MKKNNKYTYVQASSTTYQGARTYDVHGIRLPSVTTILAKTKDQAYLTRWKNEEAERIKNLSSKRGTAMHKFIEKYIQESGYEDLTPIGVEAKPMAHKIIEEGLKPISHYYGSEVTLYYPGLYAGSTDLICECNGMETIIDFKQANRPKKEEWITDYKLQIAAYAMAHDHVHNSSIQQGIIMICTPDLYFQEFRFSGDEMRQYRHNFLERLSQYHGKNVA
jgi:genome maintenance exonuclease 1